MTTLILARHGETPWGIENRYTGSSDTPLTPRGHDQADALAAWAIEEKLDAVFSSTLIRAVRTAIPSARACHLELRQEADLSEVDFGEGEGLTMVEMRERFPDAVDAFVANPASSPFPGGERGLDAITRAQRVLASICEEFPDGRVLVVTHSTLMRLLIATFVGMDPESYRSVFTRIDNVALTTLRIYHSDAQLLGFNVPPVPRSRRV